VGIEALFTFIESLSHFLFGECNIIEKHEIYTIQYGGILFQFQSNIELA
jgi:hypothetical protein